MQLALPSLHKLIHSCQVGISCLIAEMSSGVITILFNFLILSIAGNTGVAAYGIIANVALVCVASLNGIALGMQPLVSECFGKHDIQGMHTLKNYGYITALLFSTCIVFLCLFYTDSIISLFNSEHNIELAQLAHTGVQIYFIGFIGVGINLVGGSILSSVSKAREAFFLSISRGFILICFFGIVFSYFFGMIGVWTSFVCCELVSMAYTLIKTRDL